MKLKFIEAVAGGADERYDLGDFAFRPGEVAEVHDTLAAAWIASGIAAAAEEEAPAKPAKPEPEPEEEEPAAEDEDEEPHAPAHHEPHQAKKSPARHKR